MKSLVQKIIRSYQQTGHHLLKQLFLLPNVGCRFYPTCSEYAKQSIAKYGIIKGTLKSIWRIMRCNPWNKGGFDYP